MKKGKKRKEARAQRRFHLLAILSIAVLCAILFANAFENDFVYDDVGLIVNNAKIRDWHRIGEVVRTGRPVRELSFMADYRVWGLNPFGWHLSNLLLHIACSVLLFLLLNLVIKNKWVSLIAALFFAAHPIHTEAVTGIANRKEPLVMLFFVISFIAYIKKDQPSRGHLRGLLLYIGSVVAYTFALLSKQVAVTLPVMLFLYDFYFRRDLVKRNVKYYLPYLIIPLLGLLFTRATLASLMHPAYLRLTYSQIILTMIRAVVTYMKLLLLPHNLCADYSFPISESISEGGVLVAIAILLASLGFIVWVFRLSKVISFGAVWFFVNLLPVSNLIPSAYIVAERYLYIPSVGFCLLLAVVMVWFWSRCRLRVVGFSLLSAILLSYSILTIRRNFDWRSEKSLWEKTVRQNPLSRNAHNQLGRIYSEEGFHDLAFREYRKALEISPNWAVPHTNLAILYSKLGRWDEAISESDRAIETEPNYAPAHVVLGTVYARTDRYDRAILEFRRALAVDRDLVDAHYNLASVYARKGLYAEAILEYERVLRLEQDYPGARANIAALRRMVSRPDTISAEERILEAPRDTLRRHYNQANLYRERGLYDKAISEYERVLEIEPNHAATHYELGTLWSRKGLYDKAISEYKEVLKVSAGDARVHNSLGVAYQRKGEHELAISAYRAALRIDPKYAKAHLNLGALYATQGLYDQAISEYKRAIELSHGYLKAHNNLGLAYQEKGLHDEAIVEFEKVIEIDSTYCDAYYSLWTACIRKGLKERAEETYRQYLKCKGGPDE